MFFLSHTWILYSSKPFTLHQLVPLFSPSNLDEIEFQRIVSELACQEDSKTPPGNLIWSEIEWVIEALKSCSLIFSSTRSRQGFCGNQLLHQILVNFGFQGVFRNRLDEQILKLTLVSQFYLDLDEKNCCCKLITPCLMSRFMKVSAQDKFQCRRSTLGVDMR